MADDTSMLEETELTERDRLWAALSWLPVSPVWPILPIVALLIPSTRTRPFIRYNALSAVVTGAAVFFLILITAGLGIVLYFAFLYWAFQAYQGKTVRVPLVTAFLNQQGWL